MYTTICLFFLEYQYGQEIEKHNREFNSKALTEHPNHNHSACMFCRAAQIIMMTESTLPKRSLVLTNAPSLHWHTGGEDAKHCNTNSQKTKNPAESKEEIP